MKNVIIFQNNLAVGLGSVAKFVDPPVAATKTVPEWYKNMSPIFDNEKTYGISSSNVLATNTTVKSCSPFMDAIISGYMFTLPLDVEIKRVSKEEVKIFWREPADFVTGHSPNQHPGLPSPFETKNADTNVLKWSFPYTIKTPPGYSSFFTHPLNRHDLPFRTFSGVVETDIYPGAVQFPFQLCVDVEDSFIIEKGTPVCQIIPFKRENWESKIEELSIEESKQAIFKLRSKIVRSYKSQWWRKKTYT